MKNWPSQLKLRQWVFVKCLTLVGFAFSPIVLSVEINAKGVLINTEPVIFLPALLLYTISFAVLIYKYFYGIRKPLKQINQGLQNIINGKNFEANFKNTSQSLVAIFQSMHKIQETIALLMQNQQNNMLERLGIANSAQTNDKHNFLRMQLQSITAGAMQNAVENSQILTNTIDELQPIYQKSLSKADVLVDAIQENKFLTRLICDAALQSSDSIKSIVSESLRCHTQALQTANGIEEIDFKLNNLAKFCEQITSVIMVMQEIVRHINLLALNATIEASRADASGKGFGVVALEMKKLSQETSQTAEVISAHVQTIQANVVDAVVSIKNIFTVANNIQLAALGLHNNIVQQADISKNIADTSNQINQLYESMEQNILTASAAFQKTHDTFEKISISSQNVYGNNQLVFSELKSLSNFIA